MAIGCGSLTDMIIPMLFLMLGIAVFVMAASVGRPGSNALDKKLPQSLWFDRAALAAGLALATTFVPLTSRAAASVILKVEAADTLPGFHLADLSRYLALHMAEARLADWRFEPAADEGAWPDRVEWTFKLNPYAGGEVRSFIRPHMAERIFGVHRPITIEARLYLNGEYQTLVEKQAVIQGGPNDPDLAEAVANLTQTLLGPSGAYRAIDTGRHPAYGPR
jgi:hypothetical protein